MRVKIILILGIIFISALLVGTIYLKSIQGDGKIKTLEPRTFINLKPIDTINLGDTYYKMDFQDDELFFVSYKDGKQGTLFKYDQDTRTVVKATKIPSSIEDDKLKIIDSYSVISKDSVIYRLHTSSDNSIRHIFNDSVIAYTKDIVNVFQIFFINEKRALIASGDSTFTPLYYDYNFKNKVAKNVEIPSKLYRDLEFPRLALDGGMVTNNSYIYLTPHSQSKVLVFNMDSEYQGFFNLIYESPEYSLIKKGNGELVINPKNKFPNISADVTNETYYVLASERGEAGLTGTFYIDRYRLSDKSYTNSVKLDIKKKGEIPREIKIRDNKLYLLNNQKQVLVYDCKNEF